MATVKVKHLVQKHGRYYFQPSASMKRGGFRADSLGPDLAVAVARVERLNAEWDAIRKAAPAPVAVPAAGTFSRLCHDIRKSSEWLAKSHARRDEIEYSMARLEAFFGPVPVASIGPHHIDKFYTGALREGSVHRAARLMKDLRYIFQMSIRWELRTTNPALAVRVQQPKPRRAIWTEDQVDKAITAAFENGYPGVGVALGIAYDTGLSPVDVRTLRGKHLANDGTFEVQRTKTGRAATGRLYDCTVELIDVYLNIMGFDLLPEAILIRTRRGRPYSKDNLTRDVRAVRKLASIPDDLKLSDLRRTANTERAAGGASAPALAAANGWSIKHGAAILDIYTVTNWSMANTAQSARQNNRPTKSWKFSGGDAP